MLATQLNLGPRTFTTVLGFQLGVTGPADLAIHVDRVISLIALYAEAYRHTVVCASIGDVIFVLLADTTEPEPEQLRRLATAIVEQSRDSLGINVCAGIGATDKGIHHVLNCRRLVALIVRALTERGGVATLADVHADVVLLRLRDLAATEPVLAAGKLDTLAALDAKKGQTHYLPTLRAYLDAFGDVPTAAAALSVHPNTYRYRLRRLIELAGIDIANPAERLVLHLQLHLMPGETQRTEPAKSDPNDEEFKER